MLDFCLVTTLGWTKPYSGTNLAAYRMPSGTNGMYLYVDDTSSQNARLRMYESMTSISAGTGLIPTDDLISGGGYLYKSNAATTAARGWTFVSDGKMAYFMNAHEGTNRTTNDWHLAAFGDFPSYKSGDAFNTLLIASTTTSQTLTNSSFYNANTDVRTPSNGRFIARSHTQIGSCVQASIIQDYSGGGGAQYIGVGNLGYPSPIDGQIHLSPLWVGEVPGRRGLLPGIWSFLHPIASVNGGDTLTGSGGLSGRTFLIMKLNGQNSTVFFETSNTWGT